MEGFNLSLAGLNLNITALAVREVRERGWPHASLAVRQLVHRQHRSWQEKSNRWHCIRHQEVAIVFKMLQC